MRDLFNVYCDFFFCFMNDSEAKIRREAYIHVKLDKCNKTKS